MSKKKKSGKKKPAAKKTKANAEEVAEASESARESASESGSAPADEPARAPLSTAARWQHLALAGFAGIVQCLATTFSVWPLAFVCFVPTMFAIEREREAGATTKRILLLGFVHGSIGYTGGYYWLVEMLEQFSGFGMLANIGIASIFWLYHGLQQTALFWLYDRARRRGWSVTVALVPALCALETIFLFLFPSYLGAGFHDMPIFMQVADLGGPVLLSALAVPLNGVLIEVWRHRTRGERFPKRALIAAVGALVFTLAYGGYRIHETDQRAEAADHLEVGLVQVNMGIFDKREDPYEGHRRHLEQSLELEEELGEGLDLLVWPESAYTFFIPEEERNLKRRVLGRVSTPTLFGGLSRREDKSYNTAYMLDGDGEILGTYDKTYLLAFGEYLPFGETFPILYEWSPNTGHFTPGDHQRPFEWNGYRISTLLCYEDTLPTFTRSAVQQANPHLLVNITNDAWFGDTQEPWIHLALAKFRAVEHHRALVRSTNSGVSAVVDPVGRVLTHSGVFERATLHANIPMLDGWTLYQSTGNWPGWAGTGLIFWLAFIGRRRDALS